MDDLQATNEGPVCASNPQREVYESAFAHTTYDRTYVPVILHPSLPPPQPMGRAHLLWVGTSGFKVRPLHTHYAIGPLELETEFASPRLRVTMRQRHRLHKAQTKPVSNEDLLFDASHPRLA